MSTSRRSSTSRSRRWTPAEARTILDELSRSGLPASRFAARRGMGVERLYAWRRRLRRQAKPPVETARFTEVRVTPPAMTTIEVLFPNGMKVRLSGSSRVDDAVAVLTRLSGR